MHGTSRTRPRPLRTFAGGIVVAAHVALVAPLASAPPLSGSGWSPFAPIGAQAPPEVADAQWAANPIDRFVFARLRSAGMAPAPEIDRRAWLRRVAYDLTGLPPTPEDLAAFLSDPRPVDEARAAVADALLASQASAERLARHWLDVVRYADSDGFAIDSERPTLWRYRDYVVRVFAEDRPIDRFIREQVAGDELDGTGGEGTGGEGTGGEGTGGEGTGGEGAVAAGFLRLGPWEADNMVAEVKRQDYLNEITTATGVAFLGLTIGCARCHDHKYDPVPARDYYSLQAFFTPLARVETPAEFARSELDERLRARRAAVEREARRRRDDLAVFRHELRLELASRRGVEIAAVSDADLDAAIEKTVAPISQQDKERHQRLKAAIEKYDEAKRFAAVACTVANPAADAVLPATHVLRGGDVTARGEEVAPGFLSAVEWGAPELAEMLQACRTSAAGRRRVLAAWLSSPENPLTPRVFVNRLWQWMLGAGIVATANDFGRNGAGPSHPDLLDYLARRFIDGGWRTRPILRLIVLSRTYRTSLVHPDAERCADTDPVNRLLWRGHYRRLEAEALRDALLAVSGELRLERGGPGFYEELPAELGRSFPFFDWDPSPLDERQRRSIYIFQRRNLVVPLLETFDAADMNEPCERRRASVTTLQALALQNGKFVHDRSRAFALRVVREVGDDRSVQVERVFLLAFARPPRPEERAAARTLVDEQMAHHLARLAEPLGKAARAEAELAALADLCLVALNANEFLYLE